MVADFPPFSTSTPHSNPPPRQIITNGGFFITNLVSFLHPTPLSLTTPAELGPYGWTTTDLWSAPLVTGIYATLTHAQPFWADMHAVLAGVLGGAGVDKIAPLDPETARSACALVLAALFAQRTARKYGLVGTRGGSCRRRGVLCADSWAIRCVGEDQDTVEPQWASGGARKILERTDLHYPTMLITTRLIIPT